MKSCFKQIKIFLFLAILTIPFCMMAAQGKTADSPSPGDTRTHTVLVSINPYKYLVNRIAGKTLRAVVLVPPGSNMHTYEPTPKQIMQASKADIWLITGESFEEKVHPSLESYNPQMARIDLREGIDLICAPEHHGCKHCSKGCDLHYWLSPRIMAEQAKIVAKELKKKYPEHSRLYEANLRKFTKDLEILDDEFETFLAPLKDRAIFVSHPAYGYLARDYNLSQYTIEFEGKDPTPKQLTAILKTAREHNIKTVFIQKQYNNKGARLVADELNADLVELDPYADDYILEMRRIAARFAGK
jgi:zinc transport system substrate-binding protein